MKSRFLLLVLIGLYGSNAIAQPVFEGSWEGSLNVQGMQLPLVVHLSKSKDGYEGNFDSPKQNAFGILLTTEQAQGDTLRFTVADARIS